MAVNPAAGKTIALVTGANQGIGFAISKKLASEPYSYHIIMAGRNEKAIKSAAAQLQEDSLSVEPVVLDLSSDASIEAAVQQIEGRFDHLDVLVNNAGIARAQPLPGQGTRSVYQQIIDTNVIGSMSVTEHFLPLLAKSQQVKRVVFISSGAGSLTLWSTPGSPTRAFKAPAYAVSKTALNALCLQYAVAHNEEKSWKFNACCPGYCATNLNGYSGTNTPEAGADIACHLASIGGDGPTGTFVNSGGTLPW
ncbi:carbonyl reductase [Colletotrichum tofieldiae]|uniref:Carbonyl reductase (Short chain dehydrogenase) n=1 Tax=Colletotrichum tofieldiae TaxID=708197 RepID=A0A166XAP9_9PEZI|nr:carbonyl reductase (short chain dehydrogenase) [Colletotrichum tofieldiae]GKT61653.1 carbonyl reductase [Colletotrichum tofieldiae]GKT70290.1 carbonyl reductase [Colletotrichum tofieldiae]GKT93346.1 carbonyl reductase [Colletotrichum tofieldiae]